MENKNEYTLEEMQKSFNEGYYLCLKNNEHILKGKINPNIEFENESMEFDEFITKLTHEKDWQHWLENEKR